MITVGFTGTQLGMTQSQKPLIVERLIQFQELYGQCMAVHGYCIGADDEFGIIVMNQQYIVSVRPGCDENGETPKKGSCAFDIEYPPEPYLIRNKKIVDDCDVLLAAPKEDKEELRSGTWATIRYARKMKKPIEIYWPNPKSGYPVVSYENINNFGKVKNA